MELELVRTENEDNKKITNTNITTPPRNITEENKTTHQRPTDQIQHDLKLSDGDDNPSKRHATKGQWQTPPIGPFFPSSNTSASATNHASTSASTATSQPSSSAATAVPTISLQTLPVPNSSDDYAKALQEAYRRGAEAAALMSRSRPQPPPVAAATDGWRDVRGEEGQRHDREPLEA